MLTRKRPPKTTLLSGGIFSDPAKNFFILGWTLKNLLQLQDGLFMSCTILFYHVLHQDSIILSSEEKANLPQCLYSTRERPWRRGHFPPPVPAFVFIFNAVRQARGRLSFPTPSSILNRNFQLLTLFFPIFEAATRRHVTRSLDYLYMYIRNLTFKRFRDVPLYRSRERYRNKVA